MGAETRVTSRDFNREPSRIKKAADRGDVIVTEHGRPAYAFIRYEEYERLKGKGRTLYDLMLSLPEVPDSPEIDAIFDEIAQRREVYKPYDLD